MLPSLTMLSSQAQITSVWHVTTAESPCICAFLRAEVDITQLAFHVLLCCVDTTVCYWPDGTVSQVTRQEMEWASERALQVAVKSTQSQEIHLESPEGAAKELGLWGRPAGDLPYGPGCTGWSVQGRWLSSGDWTLQNTKHDLSVISKLLQCFPKSE